MSRKPLRKIGFIGAGNMATAMIQGVLEAGIHRASELWATDVLPARRRFLRRRFGVGWAADNRELVRGSQLVVLAVKPQTLPDVLREIRDALTPRTLLVSIAAGVPMRRIARELGPRVRLVRVMPNTPALLGKGMSVAVRGGAATAADERRVLRILRAIGDAIAVRDESLLDPVTGLSGSGPAYVYLFAEALMTAGVRGGLRPEVSRRLVLQTLEGACAMMRKTRWSPRELREMVSSPGGTTLAGLASLGKARFSETVIEAVSRATSRSRELGRGA